MSGINMVLNTAKDAIAVQQYGLSVTSHNISNANNASYCRQSQIQVAKMPAQYAGFIFGTGVDAEDVRRSCDQLLENRLMNQKSVLNGYEEEESYMKVMENIFNTDSESSLNALLPEFWNSWQDLSNNPSAAAERVGVYEGGSLITERFNSLSEDLMDLKNELSLEIDAAIPQINGITKEIARLNGEIVGLEVSGKTANDLRDQRNALVTDLSKYLDLKTFEQERGDITVTAANGFVLVNKVDSYDLQYTSGRVEYSSPYGGTVDITDSITNGELGGWLNLQEEAVDLFQSQLDILAKEFIWNVNLQHSQGVGLEYLSSPVNGSYETDSSLLLDTLAFGNKIDYTKDFKMWIEDNSSGTAQYTPVDIDMGISDASVAGWSGIGAVAGNYKYVFTVTEGGESGQEINVTEANGAGLSAMQTDVDVTTALDSAIAEQTITVTNSSGLTQSVVVRDIGGNASRSAASIAEALNGLSGITAYASENSTTMDITNLLAGAGDAEENDRVSFSLSSGGNSSLVSFRIGANDTETLANFSDALKSAVADVNGSGHDLSVSFSGNTAAINSAGGENIGIESFKVEDLAVATLNNFTNMGVSSRVNINNFANLTNGDQVGFSITTAQGSANVSFTVTDDTDQTTLATNLENTLAAPSMAAALSAIGVTVTRIGGTVSITGNTSAGYVDFQALSAGTGGNESFTLTAGAGTVAYPATGNGVLTFDGSSDIEQFAGNNQISFTVNGTDAITVDLRRRDATDSDVVRTAFYTALSENITNATVTDTGSAIEIAATSEIPVVSFTAGTKAGGAPVGSFSVNVQQGTLTEANNVFRLNGADSVTYTGIVTNADGITFDGEVLTEDDGSGTIVDSGVKTGTITLFLNDGYTIESDVAGNVAGAGGLFNTGAGSAATVGDSIITLGGVGGFSGLDAGDTISFDVDGTTVSYTVAAGEDTDAEFASGIETALSGALGAGYTVTRNGASVSIMNADGTDTPIQITNFTDAGGGEAISVRTGMGVGTSYPETTVLDASHTSATSLLYGSEGIIAWEKYDSSGAFTGSRGTINAEEIGPYTVDGTLAFDLNPGSLVAGNTFTLNTDTAGAAAPLDLTASGRANSILDTYVFTVKTGGEIGADPIEIEWSNSVTSGTITLPATAAPLYPTENEGITDGMSLLFNSGTLFDGDVFTVMTDSEGTPTANLPSSWHWTLDSFADQFNRQTPGVNATINSDNTLTFAATANGNTLTNYAYENTHYPDGGDPGFDSSNVTVKIDNYTALTRSGTDFTIERSGGDWIVPSSSALGYSVTLSALDDLDLDNGFTVNLDGNRAFTVTFDTPITNDGSITFDISQTSGNSRFAFSDDESGDSGIAAALGINTFFTGDDAMSIDVNSLMANMNYIAAGKIDGETGAFGVGDNRNAMDMANLQYDSHDFSEWSFDRSQGNVSNSVTSTLEGFYQSIIGNMGITSQSITSNKLFSENMVIELTAQRDSLSAVSIDEEMINLIKYQHAFSVAAKLLSVADEMLSTLVNSR